MSDYARLTFEQTKAGLHWAHDTRGEWELVEIHESEPPRKAIFVMAWDCRVDPRDYDYFVRADLVTPDGKPYET